MDINNPPDRVNWIQCVTGETIRPYLFEIGAWDMDTDWQKTVSLAPYSITMSKIVGISLTINSDAGNTAVPMGSISDAPDPQLCAVGVLGLWTNQIVLNRRTGSYVDNVGYSSIVVNRGHIIIWIKD